MKISKTNRNQKGHNQRPAPRFATGILIVGQLGQHFHKNNPAFPYVEEK
jgi:hypothetical protein